MKKLTLNHSHTPTPLKSINQRLSELTIENDPDESNFLKLAMERDEFIQDYIKNLPNDEKREFVTAELQVNGVLVAYAEESFKASLKQLTGLIRGRKAVKKYR